MGLRNKKIIFQDRIASDDCSFCGAGCGHCFRAIKIILGGYEDENGNYVLVNTCGDYSWICKECWDKIKTFLVKSQNNYKQKGR